MCEFWLAGYDLLGPERAGNPGKTHKVFKNLVHKIFAPKKTGHVQENLNIL